jgi:hypothetical protein
MPPACARNTPGGVAHTRNTRKGEQSMSRQKTTGNPSATQARSAPLLTALGTLTASVQAQDRTVAESLRAVCVALVRKG